MDSENCTIADLEARLTTVERTLDEIVASLEQHNPKNVERRVRLLAAIVGGMAGSLRTLTSRVDATRTPGHGAGQAGRVQGEGRSG
ncbi:hypothetical protein HLH34_02690 [Gluconacetobacter azotocaptans]|uniref:Uncharacterized protein n=1 Tax=Gluconacetobacter azotocaptans TaxID=142834 RepID=A0A7W4JQG9_9PROT|nr:hypothetical protein [Gluconacetobacter azotocaptans]MBB2188870.1 hypothetical protein [Gluconacetobacter azotocaptans]